MLKSPYTTHSKPKTTYYEVYIMSFLINIFCISLIHVKNSVLLSKNYLILEVCFFILTSNIFQYGIEDMSDMYNYK